MMQCEQLELSKCHIKLEHKGHRAWMLLSTAGGSTQSCGQVSTLGQSSIYTLGVSSLWSLQHNHHNTNLQLFCICVLQNVPQGKEDGQRM